MSGNPTVKTLPGNATVQTNQPAPLQQTNNRTQYAGSTSWGDSADVIVSETDPAVDPAAPPDPRAGHLRLYGRSDRGLIVRKPDGRIVPVRPPDLHVEDFAPVDNVLNASNFDSAMRAAWAYAWAIPNSPRILLPPGAWTLGPQFAMVGKSTGNLMPSLIGPGSNACTLQFDPHLLGPHMLIDGYQNGAYQMAAGMKLQGFSIQALGGVGEGIALQMQAAIMCELHDVQISGYAGGDGYTGGVCLFMRGNETDLAPLPTLENNQNITFYRCNFTQSMTGMRLAGSGPVHMYNPICNQNLFADVLIDGGVGLSIHSGMMQGDKGGRAPGRVYYGDPGYVIRHIGYRTGRNGTNATLAAPSGGLTTVTNLASMPSNCAGQYVVFSGQPNEQNNGAFRIRQYVSPSSVVLEKASGTAVSGVTWENRANKGGSVISIDGHVYHEGNQDAMIQTEVPTDSFDHFIVKGLYSHNVPTFAILNGTGRFECDFQGAYESTPFIRARKCNSIIVRGGPDPVLLPQHWDLDSQSRAGLHNVDQTGRVYSGRTARAPSWQRALAPYAADIFISDRRVSMGSDGCVQSWTGVLNGSVLAAPASGQRALFIARHADLGGRPAIGIRATNARTLAGTLAQTIPIGSQFGLLAVYVVPRGALTGSGAKRGPQLYSSAGVNDWRGFGWNDGDGVPLATFTKVGGNWGANCNTTLISQYDPVVVLSQCQYQETGQGLTARSQSALVDNGNAAFNAPSIEVVDKLQLAGNPGDTSQSNDLDYLAIVPLKMQLPPELADELMSALLELIGRVPRSAPRVYTAGTYSIVGWNQELWADVSSGAVVFNLPTGHQPGDEMEIKMKTNATNNITISCSGANIDNAASLVLSSNLAYARLRSDGTNLYRVGS